MKKLLLSLAISIGTVISFAWQSLADITIYKGGEFIVIISGEEYTGCDANFNCIHIPVYSNRERGSLIYEKNGYTYVMAATHDGSGNYTLKVFDPSNRQIVNQFMKPVFNDPETKDDFFNSH